MTIIRKIPVLKIIITIATLYSAPVFAANITLDSFIGATTDIDAAKLEKLAVAVEANLPETANHLQSNIGGRKALQQYASAMLSHGQAERLGKQWAGLIANSAMLDKAEKKDGSVWFPHAKDAGFFAGGIAAALSQHPQATGNFSTGAGLTAPIAGQDIAEWFSQSVSALSRPARAAFDQSLRAAAVH
ncbi:hypothetical protein HBA94_02560 [Ochrobactrum sp. GRS2]|nr:hypothetical protein [Ochrobactrum sp. GRS2]